MPKLPDMWLWDERSMQPTVILGKRERMKFRARFDGFRMVGSQLRYLPSIGRQYRTILSSAYQGGIEMRDRPGLSVEADARCLPRTLERLEGLEGIPLMVRCYAHLGREGLEETIAAVTELGARGHEVSLGIVQSRKSVLEPTEWAAYLEEVFAALHDRVRFVEIGHAINRVKWGVWTLAEAVRLYETVGALRARYPSVKVLGPAVNDFEFHYFPLLLSRLQGVFDGLSSHLYVDRRGEPENKQGPFSLLEKCAVGKAIASGFDVPGFYVTEANWPLTKSAEFSPVQGHLCYHGQAESRLAVDEKTYAAYMVRYLLIALCSGFCERVWWWNLASRGFGLVDDRDGWRRRSGWHALAFFHRMLGPAVFEKYEEREGARWFHFDSCSVVYARKPAEVTLPDGVTACHGLDGGLRAVPASFRMQIDGEPIYLVRGSRGVNLSV
jgi:hypothetical protein